MQIDFELRYPLYIRRSTAETEIAIVDSDLTTVAQVTNYAYAYELVRLANTAYKLMNDLSHEPISAGKQPRNLAVGEQDPH